jgi:RNA polymerase sigma factor (sigma-70 family)
MAIMPEHEGARPQATPKVPPTPFDELMARVRAGSAEAARQLYEEYGELVERAVRRRLHPRLRSVYETADFSQAVWASFLAVPAQTCSFDTPEDLARFLCSVAANKVGMAQRKAGAKKRDVQRHVPMPGDDAPETPREHRNPTPSQAAIAGEAWERLLAGQVPQVRSVLDLLRRGHSHNEAAAMLGMTPKQIQRLLKKLAQG